MCLTDLYFAWCNLNLPRTCDRIVVVGQSNHFFFSFHFSVQMFDLRAIEFRQKPKRKKNTVVTIIVRRLFIYYNVNLTRRRKIDHRFFLFFGSSQQASRQAKHTGRTDCVNHQPKKLVHCHGSRLHLASFSLILPRVLKRGRWST